MAPRSKREDILKVAAKLFVEHGYRQVSIDKIVAAVPVSKPTLYANFKDKPDLFNAVIVDRCSKLVARMNDEIYSKNLSVKQTLQNIGEQFLTMVLSNDSIRMHRTLSAEYAEFPEVAKLFYESGPAQMHLALKKYLVELDKKGELKVEDADVSADMFFSMIKGYVHLRCLLGVAKAPGEKAIKKRVEYAVNIFLRAHAR